VTPSAQQEFPSPSNRLRSRCPRDVIYRVYIRGNPTDRIKPVRERRGEFYFIRPFENSRLSPYRPAVRVNPTFVFDPLRVCQPARVWTSCWKSEFGKRFVEKFTEIRNRCYSRKPSFRRPEVPDNRTKNNFERYARHFRPPYVSNSASRMSPACAVTE